MPCFCLKHGSAQVLARCGHFDPCLCVKNRSVWVLTRRHRSWGIPGGSCLLAGTCTESCTDPEVQISTGPGTGAGDLWCPMTPRGTCDDLRLCLKHESVLVPAWGWGHKSQVNPGTLWLHAGTQTGPFFTWSQGSVQVPHMEARGTRD